MAYTGPPTNLDPHLASAPADFTYWTLIFDRLTEIGADLEVGPMLATSWEFSDDGTALDMTLRDDVVFHDGESFNADAVVANIERAQTLEGSVQKNALKGVGSVEALDDYTVRFNLVGPAANLTAVLSTGAGAMISPRAIAERSDTIASDPGDAGTGGYVIDEWVPQTSVSYVRAPETWDPQHAKLASFDIEYVPQTDARLNGLQTGVYDLANVTGFEAQLGVDLVDSGEYEGTQVTINTTHGMMLNPTRGDLASKEIRQAINYAIDRTALDEGLFDGLCDDGRLQTFPSAPWNVPELDTMYPFDPDRARELVEQSGIENPSFEVLAPAGPSYEPLAIAMQEQLADVGIEMKITTGEFAPSISSFVNGEADSLMLVILGYADPGLLLDQWYLNGTGSGMLPAGSDLRADVQTAADAALANDLTIDERAAEYAGIFTTLGEESVSIPGCATTQVWVHKPGLIGVEEMPFIWAGTVSPYTLGIAE